MVIFLFKGKDARSQGRPSFRPPGAACCPEVVSFRPYLSVDGGLHQLTLFSSHVVSLGLGVTSALVELRTVVLGMEGQCSVWWFRVWAWDSGSCSTCSHSILGQCLSFLYLLKYYED